MFASASPVDKANHYGPFAFDVDIYLRSVEKSETDGCSYYILSLPEKNISESFNSFVKDISSSYQ